MRLKSDCPCNQAAYQSAEDEVSLSTMGRTYTIDFHSMQQINEDSGTARPVQRKAATPHSGANASGKATGNTFPLTCGTVLSRK